MQKTNPEELIVAKAHFGHKSNRVHPRFRPYLHGTQQGSSIIDLVKTAQKLDEAKEFVYALGKEKKELLVIATKKHTRSIIAELCKQNSVFYMTNKWIGGFLTNFEEISKNIKKLKELKKEKTEDAWNQFVKHERVKLEKQLSSIARIYEGVEEMRALPDALFIIDSKNEEVAAAEAFKRTIPIVALVDTNGNPDTVAYPIPANDDAPSSVQYIAEQIIEAYVEGKKLITN